MKTKNQLEQIKGYSQAVNEMDAEIDRIKDGSVVIPKAAKDALEHVKIVMLAKLSNLIEDKQ